MASATVQQEKEFPPPATARRTWAAVLQGATMVLLLAVLGLALILGLAPRLWDGSSLTVLSGSMEPSYQVGDMVVVIPQDAYGIGDVVTFQPVSNDPMLVTHRIIALARGADGMIFTTRGDANGTDDDPITADQINGKVIAHLPRVGYASLAIGQHRDIVLMISGVALLAYCGYVFIARKK